MILRTFSGSSDRVAADARVAALRRIQRRENPHRRRLAGPVGPDEAEHLAALDAERHVVDGAHAVEVPDEAVELQHRRRSRLALRPAEDEVEAAALDDAGDAGLPEGRAFEDREIRAARLIFDEVR